MVYETLLTHLPNKRKQTPSGWISFNAPCCHHNGTSADTRQRGGIIKNEDGVSYHCFNCGYKASWKPGRRISLKLKKLMQWMNISDDTITKLSLAVLDTVEADSLNIVQLPKFEIKKLPDDAKLLRDYEPSSIVHVLEYMKSRELYMDDFDFYYAPETYKDRLLVPFFHNKQIVGHTARKVTPGSPKYISEQQPGYVFNIDSHNPNRIYTIVVEGPFDAISVEGVAVLGSEIKDQQALLINSLNTTVVVVPDRDEAGQKMVETALQQGWSVSMPEWDPQIKDVSEAVQHYGKIYTAHSIITNAVSNQLKIQLRSKQWFRT